MPRTIFLSRVGYRFLLQLLPWKTGVPPQEQIVSRRKRVEACFQSNERSPDEIPGGAVDAYPLLRVSFACRKGNVPGVCYRWPNAAYGIGKERDVNAS